MTIYYISQSGGSDSNNGTSSSTPYQTIAHFQSVALQGDTGLLKCGDTFPETVAFSVGVTLDAYGTGAQPKIAPASHTLSAFVGDALTFTNCGGVTIQNLEMVGSTTTYTSTVVRIITFLINDAGFHQNFTINNCTIHDGLGGVLFVNESSGPAQIVASNINFTNNNTYNFTCREGFATAYPGGVYSNILPYYWNKVTINNNIVHDVTGITTTSTYGLTVEGATGVVISNNSVARIGVNSNGTYGSITSPPFGIEVLNSDSVEIFGNAVDTVYMSASQLGVMNGGIGILVDQASSNCHIYNNVVKNCYGGAVEFYTTFGGNTVRNNVFVNNCAKMAAAGEVAFGTIDVNTANQCVITNNTVISYSGQPAFSTQFLTSPSVQVFNNAFIVPAGVPVACLAIVGTALDGNYYQSGDGLFLCQTGATPTSYTSLSAWRAAVSGESSGVGAGHCHFVQPLALPGTLAGCTAYSPLASSPLLNAGANLLGTYGIIPRSDILGNPWTQNSIGAVYVAGATNAYEAAAYTDNPISYCRLAETTATSFRDSIPMYQTGTWANATLNQAVVALGDGAPSVLFNGTSTLGTSLVKAGAIALSGFTLECSIEFNSVALANQDIVLDFNSVSEQNNFQLLLNTSTMHFLVRDTSGNVTQGHLAGVTFATGTNYHVVWTAGGTTLKTLTATINGARQR